MGSFNPVDSKSVAIIGIAFRFPGDLKSEGNFWEALKLKHDLVTNIPPDRWAVNELQHEKRSEPGRSITYSAGVLSDIDQFDAAFFGISPREAAWLDPQQRLLLELSWEAMENAGIPPSSLGGSKCGVYVGISSLDYGTRGQDDLASFSPHIMTGNTLSIAANRISYVFDLHGPSLAVDTACSSSLVALHHACNSLHTGDVSTALVGGVNLLLHPYPFVGFTKASMLSADGRCKPFDASGDGYVRSEGGAVLLLKPLEKAIADGDEIQAVILASGVNSDGSRKTGITIPSTDGQAELMREVLARSGISADDVDFIESHGTGTSVGDPVEAAAIGKIYGQPRTTPLPIGSVKSNIGHLEAASGMAGLVKAILGLKNRAVPPLLHLQTPNPRIDFQTLNLKPVTEYTLLEKPLDKPLVAGVNSFGFGGANAHVLLREFLPEKVEARLDQEKSLPPIFLSASSDAALRCLSQSYADFLNDQSEIDFYDIAYSAAFRRDHLEKRLAFQPDSVANAVDVLQRFAEGSSVEQIIIEDGLPETGDLAFVYSGNGSQWVGMGRTLLADSPRFTAIMNELDAAMLAPAGFSLIDELAKSDPVRLEDTTVAQPLLFAIQVAITTLLREQGVRPKAVMGHSVGEIAAAWAAGALNLEQAIHVICARSQSQGLTRGNGRMAAVGLTLSAANELITEFGGEGDLEIAGINSPNNVTISGSFEKLTTVKELLEQTGVFFRLLDLDYAFHSREMDPIKGNLSELLDGLEPSESKHATFISTVTGDVLNGVLLNAEYWWRNVREPVQFSEGVEKLAEIGCKVFVEIGPHAILQRYIGECLSGADIKGRVIASLLRNDDGIQRIVETALRVHLLVEQPQLKSYFPFVGRNICLPNYPWQRERHWHPRTTEGLGSIERRRVHPLLGWRLPDAEMSWENILDAAILPWLADHKVGGAVVFPGAAYTEMALAAAREWMQEEHFTIEQMDIISPMVFVGEHGRTLRFLLNPRDGGFQIKSRQRLSSDEWSLHAAGRLLESTGSFFEPAIAAVSVPIRKIDRFTHYKLASSLGLEYGPFFQGMREARLSDDLLEADLSLPEGLSLDSYLLHPAVLDVCFQSLVNFFAEEIDSGQGLALLPVKTERLDVYSFNNVVRFRVVLRRRSTRSVLADFELLDDGNKLVARAVGCRFRAAHFKRQDQKYVTNWRVMPWLRPHPVDGLRTTLPSTRELVTQGLASLNSVKPDRQAWFKQTLPLIEALVLSFVHESFRELAERNPTDWRKILSGPHTRWMADLLIGEGLLTQDTDSASLSVDAGLPSSADLWQTILRDSPTCLPQLALLGRLGRQLTSLFLGEVSQEALHNELNQSPVSEVIYNDDPLYLGSRMVIEAVVQHAILSCPASHRVRILEITGGSTELTRKLVDQMPEDRLDYVLALTSDTAAARQQAEFQDHANVTVTSLNVFEWQMASERPTPDVYDIIILRHTLHRAGNPHAALAHARRFLASGGLLVLAERYPDWGANFIAGLDARWWHDNPLGGAPLSPLRTPEVWQQAVIEEDFTDCELAFEPEAEGLVEGVYLLLAKRKVEDAESLPEPKPNSWIMLADQASITTAELLRTRLESQGHRASVVHRSKQDALLDFSSTDHVVHLIGWMDSPDKTSLTLAGLTQDVKSLAAQNTKSPRLWIVTRNGALASGLQSANLPNPAQSALWGFGRVVMNEIPALSCTLIDLDCDPSDEVNIVRIENELLLPDNVTEVVLSEGARHCLVMQEITEQLSQKPSLVANHSESRFHLDFQVPGQLRNLLWLPDREQPLAADEIEVSTRATGLNFRDVMYLMGLLPDEAVENGFAGASLGLEFSGVVKRVGSRVSELTPGDEVMGFGSSCFSSHITTRADAVARMPKGWAFEAAATVPTVFFTVYYALKYLANLQPGERVLIHGAAGGVGIAAIQLARHMDAEIYATAGTDEKRDFVKLLGADRVFDSRTLAFADEIRAATGGEGVDLVLNSLAGEPMRRSLDLLKPFGRFLELGKRDFFENTSVGLRPFRSNISYFGIDADQLLTAQPKLASKLFREVMSLFREGALAPLPFRLFTADRVVDAFRSMQQARHIGKVVVSMADAAPDVVHPTPEQAFVSLKKESTWIVTGGLSGFGLESARWLAANGAGALVLVGRRGIDTPGASGVLETLSAQGVTVVAEACDISDSNAVTALIERVKKTLPPLRGVLHAAATFDDRLIANLDLVSIENVTGAKLRGAWNLHKATFEIPLDYFILYSSFTTAIGNPGQANYVAANAGLEGLTAMRRHMGLPASCISWGPIADAGYLVRNQAVKDSLEQRLGKSPLPAAKAVDQLNAVINDVTGFSIIANLDWNTLSRLLPSSSGTRFDVLNRHRTDQGQGGDAQDIRALIAGKNTEEITDLVRVLVIQEVGQILSISSDRIDPKRSLHDQGMDSLMAVELAVGLEQRFGIQLPVMMLNDSPTADSVTQRIIEKLVGDSGTTEMLEASDRVEAIIRQHGGGVSTEEIEHLADDVRQLAKTGTRFTA